MKCTPLSSAATVDDPGVRAAALADNSAYSSSKVFTRADCRRSGRAGGGRVQLPGSGRPGTPWDSTRYARVVHWSCSMCHSGWTGGVVMTEEVDMIDVLIKDHGEVEEMFVDLESGQGGPAHRREVADRVITELVRHSVAEEQYLYPATRDVLPGGDALADQEIAEHAAAERVMKELEGTDPMEPAFDTL